MEYEKEVGDGESGECVCFSRGFATLFLSKTIDYL